MDNERLPIYNDDDSFVDTNSVASDENTMGSGSLASGVLSIDRLDDLSSLDDDDGIS